ncbi:MAG: nitrate/nitrite transporter [Haloarculaceae archaeon]
MNWRATEWWVLAGCFLASVGVNAFMIAPSSIAPLFVAHFDIPTAAAGNIVSAAIVGSLFTQIPGGYLLDRYDNRWVVVPAVAGFVAAVLAIQVVGSFEAFMALRVLGGIVGGFVFTAGANVVGQVFPADRQGFATGLYMTSPPVSFALAHATSPLIGAAVGPLPVFLLHAAVTVVGTVLFLLVAPGAIRSAEPPTAGEFARALRNRAVILVACSAFSVYALYLFLNTWLPTYGTDVLSLSIPVAGFVTALVPLIGILSRPSGGWLSSRLGSRRAVLAGGLLVGLALLVAIPFVDAIPLFLVLLAVAAFTVQLGMGVYYVLIRELATPGTEGTSLTVMTTIGFTGSFSAPIVGGWLISTYSWPVAFATFAAVGVLGTAALVPVSEPGPGAIAPTADSGQD